MQGCGTLWNNTGLLGLQRFLALIGGYYLRLVHCFPVHLFLKFIMYSYRFSPNMQIYLLRFCAAESMIPIFRPFSSTGQLSKSCTSLVSFLLSIKSMQIWSVNLVLPWCNLLPRKAVHFSLFFKFAEWAGVCKTRERAPENALQERR